MAWTTPLTAVSNATLTAAQWNASVRDNLNETAVAKATVAGQHFVATGPNAVAARLISGHYIGSAETTTSTTYTDLTSPGATVTVTTGTRALVFASSRMWNTGISYTHASYEITGATASSPSDSRSAALRLTTGGDSSAGSRLSVVQMESGLTSGSNTFTMKYRVTAGTGRFDERHIFVIPF